jgi:hypothetical protein
MGILGTGLLSSIPLSDYVLARAYSYQILHGLGTWNEHREHDFIAQLEVEPSHQGTICRSR